jgi:hypothetical protein
MVHVSGTVTFVGTGEPMPGARVTASTRDTAFTDASGHYSLTVPASTDSVTLIAKDAFVAVQSVVCTHVTHVLATHSQTVDMVLDDCIAN